MAIKAVTERFDPRVKLKSGSRPRNGAIKLSLIEEIGKAREMGEV